MKIQMMKRKRVLRWLRRECVKLPAETYQALHKLHRPIYTDPQGNLYTNEMDKAGVPKRMVWQFVEDHPVNHYRRCKRLYDKFGFMAIHAYFHIKGGMRPETNEG